MSQTLLSVAWGAAMEGGYIEVAERMLEPEESRRAAMLGYIAPGELALPRSNWPDRLPSLGREFWVRVAFGSSIATFTGVALATEVKMGAAALVGLTAIITAIWLIALRKTAILRRVDGAEAVIVVLMGTVVGLAAVSLLNFWLLEAQISPSTLLLMGGSVFILAGAYSAVAAHQPAPRRRILVVGADEAALTTISELEADESSEFECMGLVAKRCDPSRVPNIPVVTALGDVVEIVRRGRPELVVCSGAKVRTRTVARLLDAGITSARVVDLLEFSELAFERIPERQVSPAWFTRVLDSDARHYSARAKRAFDITFAALALILAVPLLLVIAVLVRLSGPGPVLYRQVRSGEGGKLFTVLKFRTMVQDAESGEAVWAAMDDPRVTPIGRVLRKSRLDELPQFWNVLRGEMSVVGPRPERPEFLDVLQEKIPFWSRRYLLKPGITGWAQVHAAYTDDISGAASKLSYDLYYLKHRSVGLDFLILLKTVGVVVSGSGAR